jgi:D-alanyl-D-alanine dipeptidase
MKPYQAVPICDCGEPLWPIPSREFALMNPPPYQVLGAPYGNSSPFSLRAGVLAALRQAQQALMAERPGWRIQIFDAFRPISVQQFMVDYTFRELVRGRQLSPEQLSPYQKRDMMAEVLQFWAIPSSNPATPPPHSTGAALDVTLVDADGAPVDMGSPIDEVSSRSFPDHFAHSASPDDQQVHAHRLLLRQIMMGAGFRQHPNEWWHFSLGDQLWAWLMRQETHQDHIVAKYGRVFPDQSFFPSKSG